MPRKNQTSETKADARQESNGKADSGQTPSDHDVAEERPFPSEIEASFSFDTYPVGQFSHEELKLDEDRLLDMYRSMLLQRRFEERAAQMYGKQKIAGFLHLYIGQEAVSTGTAAAMEIGKDSVITAYRDHGIGLALGMTADECMAELFGKKTGCSRGKGGSMHFFSKELRFFGGHGIVGAHIPVGAGIAFGHKYNGDGGVCLTFFGDGAVGQGSFHEACNLASLYDLPAIFVIENNEYAMGTSIHRAFAETEFTRHAISYDMPACVVDGMDVFSVYRAMQKHIALAREGKPSLMEVRTYRYRGHSMSDPQKYRTKEELERKKSDDPILRLKAYLIDGKLSDNDALDEIDDEVKQTVVDAVKFAEESEFPDPDAIYENVYEESDYPFLA